MTPVAVPDPGFGAGPLALIAALEAEVAVPPEATDGEKALWFRLAAALADTGGLLSWTDHLRPILFSFATHSGFSLSFP